jgi:hypothetical protein
MRIVVMGFRTNNPCILHCHNDVCICLWYHVSEFIWRVGETEQFIVAAYIVKGFNPNQNIGCTSSIFLISSISK